MSLEFAGGNELAELMANHVLGDEDGDVGLSIVDAERVAHEFRGDGAGPGPSADDFLLARGLHGLHLLEKFRIDVDSFFKTSAHSVGLLR